jgi:hypothetical protein
LETFAFIFHLYNLDKKTYGKIKLMYTSCDFYHGTCIIQELITPCIQLFAFVRSCIFSKNHQKHINFFPHITSYKEFTTTLNICIWLHLRLGYTKGMSGSKIISKHYFGWSLHLRNNLFDFFFPLDTHIFLD